MFRDYRSILVRLFGFRAMLIHGDCLVLDRWRWICEKLPVAVGDDEALDVGCGSGAFTIGVSKRGYKSTGLSWDERNQQVGIDRAKQSQTNLVEFRVADVRHLKELREYKGRFDVILCMECIEHIIDDLTLMKSISTALKPGGRLLLSTPNLLFKSMTGDLVIAETEDGAHVRRGYNKAMLKELCLHSGLCVEDISYCSGFFSQKITVLQRKLAKISNLFAWFVILPLRVLPVMFDASVARLSGYPGYSICLDAYKPRYPAD